ncbi:MAG: hypothetical protein ABJN69_11830 [Hellea sp.]
MDKAAQKLKDAIHSFLVSDAPTIEMANTIEVLLDEHLDDGVLEHTQEILARFRPEGGDYLFDTAFVQKKLSEAMSYIETQKRNI